MVVIVVVVVVVVVAVVVVVVGVGVGVVVVVAAAGGGGGVGVSTPAQLCPTSGTLAWLALRRCHGMQTPSLSLQRYSAFTLVCNVGDLGKTKPWDLRKESPGP